MINLKLRSPAKTTVTRLLKTATATALLLVSPQIFAGLLNSSVPPDDLSVKILGSVFGNNVGSIYLGNLVNGYAPNLASLMKSLNFIVLLFALTIMSYTLITSTINSGHEGEFMMRKGSAIWQSIRSILGLTLLIPSGTTGYSMIQVFIMWIVLQGIGAADSVWQLTLEGIASGLSITNSDAKNIGGPSDDVAFQLVQTVLDSEICNYTFLNAAKSLENIAGNTWVAQHGNELTNYVTDVSTSILPDPNAEYPTSVTVTGTMNWGINSASDTSHKNICGSLKISGIAYQTDYVEKQGGAAMLKDAQKIFDTKKESIGSIKSVLGGLASGLMPSPITNKAKFAEPVVTSPPEPPKSPQPSSGMTSNAMKAYIGKMQGLTTPLATTGQSAVDITMQKGVTNGWITAGSFYFVLNQTSVTTTFADAAAAMVPDKNNIACRFNSSNNDSCQKIAYQGGDPFNPAVNSPYAFIGQALSTAGVTSTKDRINLARYLAQGSVYMNMDRNAEAPSSLNLPVSDVSGQISAGLNPVGALSAQAIASIQHTMHEASGDPLYAHAILGRNIMLGCEIAWIGLNIMVLGATAGLGILGAGYPFGEVIVLIANMFGGMLAMMWAVGASLAIYTPMIPYMMFTVAAAGWLMGVVEAMIGAPLVALSVIDPSEEELGKLGGAISILTNTFLRPTLMVFGFLLAISVYKAAIVMVDFGIGSVFKTLGNMSIFSGLVIIMMYVIIITSLANNCFSLIYVLPDKILRWIGGAQEKTDTGAIHETKSQFESGVHAISSAGENISKGISTAMQKQNQAGIDKKDQDVQDTMKKMRTEGKSPTEIRQHMREKGMSDDKVFQNMMAAGFSRKDMISAGYDAKKVNKEKDKFNENQIYSQGREAFVSSKIEEMKKQGKSPAEIKFALKEDNILSNLSRSEDRSIMRAFAKSFPDREMLKQAGYTGKEADDALRRVEMSRGMDYQGRDILKGMYNDPKALAKDFGRVMGNKPGQIKQAFRDAPGDLKSNAAKFGRRVKAAPGNVKKQIGEYGDNMSEAKNKVKNKLGLGKEKPKDKDDKS